jgi:signal transduction histidine kinase
VGAGLFLALLGGDVVLLLIGMHHAVVRLPRRQAVGAAVAGTVVVAISVVRTVVRPPHVNPLSILVVPGDGAQFPAAAGDLSADTVFVLRMLVIAFGVASLVIALGAGYLVRRTRRMKAVEAVAAHQMERSEALTVELARESERQMLARELHDTLAHRLSVISLHSGALEVSANDPQQTARIATALGQEARASLEDVRSLVSDVRGDAQAPATAGAPGAMGRPPALVSLRTVPDLVASVRATGVPVTATLLLEDVDRAPAVLEKAVYRIVQEALTNVMKHAPGAEATVEVRVSAASGAHVLVTNPVPRQAGREDAGPVASGAAADLSGSGGGRGLIGIRERAQLVGGEVFTGVRGDRFVVDVRLPPF